MTSTKMELWFVGHPSPIDPDTNTRNLTIPSCGLHYNIFQGLNMGARVLYFSSLRHEASCTDDECASYIADGNGYSEDQAEKMRYSADDDVTQKGVNSGDANMYSEPLDMNSEDVHMYSQDINTHGTNIQTHVGPQDTPNIQNLSQNHPSRDAQDNPRLHVEDYLGFKYQYQDVPVESEERVFLGTWEYPNLKSESKMLGEDNAHNHNFVLKVPWYSNCFDVLECYVYMVLHAPGHAQHLVEKYRLLIINEENV
jgi:hypothetical protein